MSEFFIKRGEKVQGPVSLAKIKRLADAGKLRESDLIARSKSGAFTEVTHYFKLTQTQGQASGESKTINPASDAAVKRQMAYKSGRYRIRICDLCGVKRTPRQRRKRHQLKNHRYSR